MGIKQITVDGETYELDEQTTIADLKAETGAAPSDVATYVDATGSIEALSDRDTLAAVDDGTTMAFQMSETRFGGSA